MRIHGSIRQIFSDVNDSCFINIKDAGSGGLLVEGSIYEAPTYLVQFPDNIIFQILQFEDEEWAGEFFDNNSVYQDAIIKKLERVEAEDK